MERKIASLTKYEKIFKKTYWGNFTLNNFEKVDELINNRNDFAYNYNLVKYVSKEKPTYAIKLFDHCELYKCKNGYVYIVSPYNYKNHAQDADKFMMMKYCKLYADDALTYIKIFQNKVEFNRYMRTALKILKDN